MSNLSISLIKHKKITTTLEKAKELRRFVERLVTYAKRNDLHGRRLIMSKIKGNLKKDTANILIHDIAPNYSSRDGGYTRIIKLNNRKNDNANMSIIEFVDLKATDDSIEEKPENIEDEK
jgi:large subunit ribosomal protein L17